MDPLYINKINFLWGKFIWWNILIILLNAKKSSIYLKSLYFKTKYYANNWEKNIWNKSYKVKIRDLRRQLAVIFIKKNNILGVDYFSKKDISNYLINNIVPDTTSEGTPGLYQGVNMEIKEIETPIKIIKRLNAKDLMDIYIMGLLEGDGWFSVSKKGKYLMYEIGIELHIRDIKLLYKIKKHLGVGTIGTRTRKGKNDKVLELAYYRIRDKKILKNIIIPIFDKYNFYTNKHYDYMFLKDSLLKDIKYYDDLPLYTRPINKPYLSYNDILNNKYFKYWLIGFIEAESNFSTYIVNKENKPYKIISFQITQTNEYDVIKAISIFFKITSNIYIDKTNSFSIKTTRIICLQNIIKFIEKSPIKLQGHKHTQYLTFLKDLENYSVSSFSPPGVAGGTKALRRGAAGGLNKKKKITY